MIYVCFVNTNQFEGQLDRFSDEEVFKLANENNSCYTLERFETSFNENFTPLVDASNHFVRIIELKEKNNVK